MRREFALGMAGLVVALACDDAHKVGEDVGVGGRSGATGGQSGKGGGRSGATGGQSGKGGGGGLTQPSQAGTAGDASVLDATCTWPTAAFEFTVDDPSKYCVSGLVHDAPIQILTVDGENISQLGSKGCIETRCATCISRGCIAIAPSQVEVARTPRAEVWDGSSDTMSTCGTPSQSCRIAHCVEPGRYVAKYCVAPKGSLSTCQESDPSRFIPATACVEVPFDFPTTGVVRGQITTLGADGAAGASGAGGFVGGAASGGTQSNGGSNSGAAGNAGRGAVGGSTSTGGSGGAPGKCTGTFEEVYDSQLWSGTCLPTFCEMKAEMAYSCRNAPMPTGWEVPCADSTMLLPVIYGIWVAGTEFSRGLGGITCHYRDNALVGAESYTDSPHYCNSTSMNMVAGETLSGCKDSNARALCLGTAGAAGTYVGGAAGAAGANSDPPNTKCYNTSTHACQPCCPEVAQDCSGKPDGYPGYACVRSARSGDGSAGAAGASGLSGNCTCQCRSGAWRCDC